MHPLLLLIPKLLDPVVYNRYRDAIEIDKSLDKFIKLCYEVLDKLHECRPDVPIQWEVFKYSVLSKSSTKDSISHIEFLSRMEPSQEESSVSCDILLSSYEERRTYTRLAEESFNLAGGIGNVEKFRELTTKCLGFIDNVGNPDDTERLFVNKDLENLFTDTIKSPGLRWRLQVLNKSIGSLRKGDFGFIFGRPEVGKTTFLASELTHMVGQQEGPILWFNTEEQGNKVLLRCYQAALYLTQQDLMKDRDTNERRYQQITNGNIKIHDSAALNRRDVERVCRIVPPSLIVFDTLDSVKGFSGDREDLRLGNLYQWVRELAKEYCPVIGVTHADGSAEGVKWLNMDHVVNAKTEKQKHADFILGIGKTNDPNMETIRHLHLSKNKLSGDQDTLPELRHGRFDVLILPEVARYKDII